MNLTVQQMKDMGYTETEPGIFRKTTPQSSAMAPPNDFMTTDRKRIRQSSKPIMNKLELEYFEVLKCRWKIIVPQGIRLMLANGVWYKPDFVVWPVGLESQDHRLRIFECKGPHAFRGGKENLKIAAHQYPQLIFTLAWKDQHGHWIEQTIYP